MKFLAAALFLAVLALTGCQSPSAAPRDYVLVLARFFLEENGQQATRVMLPRSGVNLAIGAQPVFTEADIANVELMQVELGQCLMFQLTASSARDLYRLSASHQGRRLVLVLNGEPIGARRIEGPLGEGNILVFVELADAALPALVVNLKKTIAELQRAIARKG
ncbi:MAG: hypothetical protein EXS32_06205 [Opitutus sp.]|nr:hypothetical protein [Opitutus sp.]